MVDIQSIEYCRDDFPVLSQTVRGKRLSFLDTASSAQKPRAVIDKMRDVMELHYANIHRGLYAFSQATTQEYESVRRRVSDFIKAASENEIVFTRNATEGINLVAHCWGGTNIKASDEIILTEMEHHANIVPWQLLQDRIGFTIKTIPVTKDGTLDLDMFQSLLSNKTKLVGVVHISNTLGTVNPVGRIAQAAKAYNPDIRVLVDASQSVVHGAVNVQALGCDFLVFTGHKLYGPTGVGVLWGRHEVLQSMPPYQGGGDMIEQVSFAGTTYKDAPARFEAGTPAILEVIGLGAAIDYIRTVGQENIETQEKAMLDYMSRELARIDGLTYFSRAQERAGIVSFTADWAQPADITMILDQCGVAVRTGHHCCMPLMKALGVEGTIRASIGLYTNKEDIDGLCAGLRKAKELLS